MKPMSLSAVIFIALALTAPVVAEDKNPGHLKMALVNLKSLYSDGPDAAATVTLPDAR